MPVPDAATVKLKERKDYRLLGKWYTGVDNRAVVTGAPLFGIDQTLPGMKIAVYQRCPAVGGKVRSANLDEVKALPGVRDAFVIEGNGKTTEVMPGVAIVADTTWSAMQAQRALRVEWDESAGVEGQLERVRQARRRARQTTHRRNHAAEHRRRRRRARGRRQDRFRLLHLPVRVARAARAAELHGLEPRRHHRVLGADADRRSRARRPSPARSASRSSRSRSTRRASAAASAVAS